MDVAIVESGSVSPRQLDAWQRLFESQSDARFYHHPHWHDCIAKHISPSTVQLAFLSIDNELRMVLPLCDAAGNTRRAHPSHDHLSLNDVLVDESLAKDKHVFLDALHCALEESGNNWCNWQIVNVPQQSLLVQTLAEFDSELQAENLQAHVSNIHTNGHKFSGSWLVKQSRYSASFNCASDTCPPSGKLRRNLRRLRKQLEENGTIRVETVTEPAELPEAFEHFLNLEASGWKGDNENATAIKANDSLREFYNALLSPTTAGVQPNINLLWCDDECIAAQFGLRTGDYLSLLKIAYNEEYARFSPGYLLLESILEQTGKRNISTLSLVTSPPWADRWHPDTVPVWHVNYYKQSSLGIALHQINKLKQVAIAQMKKAA